MFALIALRAALVLAVALVTLKVLTRASAATRRSVLVAAFAFVLVLPLVTAALPALHLRRAAAVRVLVANPAAVPELVDGVIAAAPVSSTAPIAAPQVASPLSASSIALAVWALGLLLVLARFAVGLARARRLVRSARFVETLVDGVEVRISDAIDTPAVTGVFRPVVLLPRDATEWTAERRQLVLEHELAHVTSRDCLANAVSQLALALHWFNPLAWVAARRLRIERELAADERVLASGVRPSSYAEHLLALATGTRAMPSGALAMADASQISVRIRALVVPRARLGRGRFAVIAGALALASFIACATPEREVVLPPSETAPPAAGTSPQSIVEEEIERMYTEWGPCAAIVLVLDPQTGQVIAAAHRGGTETSTRDAAVRPIVPGSTVKPLVIAAAIDDGVISPTDRFDTSPQPFTSHLPAIVDETVHGTLDVGGILAVSSNVGIAKIFDKMGPTKGAAWMRRFHFAAAPASVPAGRDGAAYAIGAKLSSNPLEVAAAFAALASGGIYHAPSFTAASVPGERVVRAETAATTLALLESVTVNGGTGTAARVDGVRVAGKTGTVHLAPESATGERDDDYYASFVGTAPLEDPRYVIFVGAETPREGGSGGKVAAPVFSRVMTRLLARK